MSAADDEADIEQVLAGNIAAFEGIVKRWQNPLINLAYRFCRDRSRAEDMAQEAFLRAFRRLSQWRNDAAFSTWLFALAANVYRSELQRIPAQTASLQETDPADPLTSISLEDEEGERAVRQAVSTLPPKYRDAVILFYFHDKDIAAAAKSLNLPDGTVKARLFRGRELLRSKLRHVMPTPRVKGTR